MFYSEVRVGGLFNLKGKQALLIMKLQCNQRKSLEHFTRKSLRHINSTTEKKNPSIFFAESASTNTDCSLITLDPAEIDIPNHTSYAFYCK